MKRLFFSLTLVLIFSNVYSQQAKNSDVENKSGTNAPMNVSVSYSPLLGFWIGSWPLGLNISLTQKVFEMSSTFAYHAETSSEPKDIFFNICIGARYLLPSRSNTHFYIHGLLGYAFHKESSSGEEGTFFSPYSAQHSGVCLVPGMGIDIKKPASAGIRLGINFIASPGYDTKIWVNNFSGALQLILGFIF